MQTKAAVVISDTNNDDTLKQRTPNGTAPGTVIPLAMPDFGFALNSVRVSLWRIEPGETIEAGDRVVELLAPGVTADVSSPYGGKVSQIVLSVGQTVNPGDVLAWIRIHQA